MRCLVQLPVPVKNWYVPLFDTNLPRPITQALPCFVTQYVDIFFWHDVKNDVHALRNVLVHQQGSFFFVVVLYFSHIVEQTHTPIIYGNVI